MSLFTSIVGGALNFIPVVGPTLSNVVSGSGSTSTTERVSKSEFYAYRDAGYSQIFAVYGEAHLANLPGNPFHQFSHGAIADSPFKNYASEKTALTAAFVKYYPSLFGAAPAPRQPVITNDPEPSTTDPITGEGPGTTTSTGKMNIPVWLWIVAAVLLFGKKLFK